ncbi:MAG TPA: amidohydrolase family protein [Chitinophagaceae bacterium]
MALLKFRAEQLFDGYRLQDDQHVLITSDEGVILDIVSPEDAGDEVQQFKGILTPGFINCHCHLELSHMKGLIPERTGLADFVWQVITQRHFAENEILQAIEKAEDEMLANGIVAIGDICNNALTIQQKLKGRIWYHNFIEASGFNPQVVKERFERSVGYFAAYAQLYSIPVESNSIVPHAAYSVSDELWEKIVHFPGNHLLTIHNQETADEDELFRAATGGFLSLYEKMKMDISFFNPSGKSSLQTYLPKFLPNQSVILVHNVHTTVTDIQVAKNSGLMLAWCLCPNANKYISDRVPPVDLLINENCHIVLGTDSLASNHQLNILEEIKTIQHHFPHITVETLLQWATSNGAKALQVDKLVGSFEKGKKPGVILIDSKLEKSKRII